MIPEKKTHTMKKIADDLYKKYQTSTLPAHLNKLMLTDDLTNNNIRLFNTWHYKHSVCSKHFILTKSK